MSVTLLNTFLKAMWKKERHGYYMQDGVTTYNWPSYQITCGFDADSWDVDG